MVTVTQPPTSPWQAHMQRERLRVAVAACCRHLEDADLWQLLGTYLPTLDTLQSHLEQRLAQHEPVGAKVRLQDVTAMAAPSRRAA